VTSRDRTADRAAGCLLGLALGEWASAGAPGDATALARNLVRSLAAAARFDPEDLIERHLAWFRTDPSGVSTLTGLVLRRVEGGEAPREVARAVWEERGPEVSAGNGSVMYCAPLGAAYARRSSELEELAPALSALTHYDERCGTACLAVALVTANLVGGDPAEAALRGGLEAVLDREGGEELEFLVEAVGSTRRIDGPDRGFCLYAAAAGLQSVLHDESFERSVHRVIGFGGDTDTNAAVAGALLGARDGASALPVDRLDALRDRGELEREAAALARLIARS
jgi:ADP-ribosyl-[dinitrogen reductase] hydrolase